MENLNFDKLLMFAGVFLALSLLVILAILVDLWDGVYTARKLRRRVHSRKLRVTAEKFSEYWRFLILGFLVDVVGWLFSFYMLPFVTMLFGVGLIIIEVKSMFEHANKRKSGAVKLTAIIGDIIDCAGENQAKRIISNISRGILADEIKEKQSNERVQDTAG